MAKDTSISIRLDSRLKEQTESVLEQFGLNMTAIVNMLFHQIVREQAIPLSLSLKPKMNVIDELNFAKTYRLAGYVGRTADNVARDMEQIITEIECGKKKYSVILARQADKMLLLHTEFLARVSPPAARKLLADFKRAAVLLIG